MAGAKPHIEGERIRKANRIDTTMAIHYEEIAEKGQNRHDK
jgi:hypothetical protein